MIYGKLMLQRTHKTVTALAVRYILIGAVDCQRKPVLLACLLAGSVTGALVRL